MQPENFYGECRDYASSVAIAGLKIPRVKCTQFLQ